MAHEELVSMVQADEQREVPLKLPHQPWCQPHWRVSLESLLHFEHAKLSQGLRVHPWQCSMPFQPLQVHPHHLKAITSMTTYHCECASLNKNPLSCLGKLVQIYVSKHEVPKVK